MFVGSEGTLGSVESLKLEETNWKLRTFEGGGHKGRYLLYDTTVRDVMVA